MCHMSCWAQVKLQHMNIKVASWLMFALVEPLDSAGCGERHLLNVIILFHPLRNEIQKLPKTRFCVRCMLCIGWCECYF